MLKLVASNEWTMFNMQSTGGIEMYHKKYHNNLHGVVFVDEDGGNSVLFDSNSNIVKMQQSAEQCFLSLQKICDSLTRITKAV